MDEHGGWDGGPCGAGANSGRFMHSAGTRTGRTRTELNRNVDLSCRGCMQPAVPAVRTTDQRLLPRYRDLEAAAPFRVSVTRQQTPRYRDLEAAAPFRPGLRFAME